MFQYVHVLKVADLSHRADTFEMVSKFPRAVILFYSLGLSCTLAFSVLLALSALGNQSHSSVPFASRSSGWTWMVNNRMDGSSFMENERDVLIPQPRLPKPTRRRESLPRTKDWKHALAVGVLHTIFSASIPAKNQPDFRLLHGSFSASLVESISMIYHLPSRQLVGLYV